MALSAEYLHPGETLVLAARAGLRSGFRRGVGKAYLTNESLLWLRGAWWLNEPIIAPPKLLDLPLTELNGVEQTKHYWGPHLRLQLKDGRVFHFGLNQSIFFWPEERAALAALWQDAIQRAIGSTGT
jgi:hypothetical protein